VLWTNYYSNQFVLFVALAILQSHRDVIIRYLTEFDEVLKYANDLSGTVSLFLFGSTVRCGSIAHRVQIDLDTTLAQAEVLFLSFRGLLEDLDRKLAGAVDLSAAGLRKRRGSGVSVRSENGKVGRDVSELRGLLVSWSNRSTGAATDAGVEAVELEEMRSGLGSMPHPQSGRQHQQPRARRRSFFDMTEVAAPM
jgi:hypothetical protein